MSDVLQRVFPEVGAGGFTHLDGTLEFYTRINVLVRPSHRVLDLGAGRGSWLDLPDGFKRQLRYFKGRVKEVVGFDVDKAIHQNESLDRAVVGLPDEPLPFGDGYFDVIIADFVLEHVADPSRFSSEIRRVLKKGGWLCARTPNRWGYISLATRLIRNSRHPVVLKRAQPFRKEVDIFPTVFKLNSMNQLRRHFPPSDFADFTYYYQSEPSYHFNSVAILQVMRFLDWIVPPSFSTTLFVFMQRL